MGSWTSLKWMRRLLLGEMEASGHSPSEPQLVVVLVVPPLTPPLTAEGEGREGGERCFPDALANMVELIFLRHGWELLLCHHGGDGLTMQGGSVSDGCWFNFDNPIANFEARYSGRQHGKAGELARGSDTGPPPSQQGWGGGGLGGVGAAEQ